MHKIVLVAGALLSFRGSSGSVREGVNILEY